MSLVGLFVLLCLPPALADDTVSCATQAGLVAAANAGPAAVAIAGDGSAAATAIATDNAARAIFVAASVFNFVDHDLIPTGDFINGIFTKGPFAATDEYFLVEQQMVQTWINPALGSAANMPSYDYLTTSGAAFQALTDSRPVTNPAVGIVGCAP